MIAVLAAAAHHKHGLARLPFVPAGFHVTPQEGFWTVIVIVLILLGPRTARAIRGGG